MSKIIKSLNEWVKFNESKRSVSVMFSNFDSDEDIDSSFSFNTIEDLEQSIDDYLIDLDIHKADQTIDDYDNVLTDDEKDELENKGFEIY
jgi:hypothetical protein